jgi:hypothetical protein
VVEREGEPNGSLAQEWQASSFLNFEHFVTKPSTTQKSFDHN